MRAKLTSVSWYAPPRAGTRGGRSAIGPALDVDDGLVVLAVTLAAALAVPAFFDGAALLFVEEGGQWAVRPEPRHHHQDELVDQAVKADLGQRVGTGPVPLAVQHPVERTGDHPHGHLRVDLRTESPIGDAGHDDPVPELESVVAPVEDAGDLGHAQQVLPVVVDDGHLFVVGGQHPEHPAEHVLGLRRPGALEGGGCLLCGDQLVVEWVEDQLEDLRLGLEVGVEAARQQATGVGDIPHRGVLESTGGEDGSCDTDNLVSPSRQWPTSSCAVGVGMTPVDQVIGRRVWRQQQPGHTKPPVGAGPRRNHRARWALSFTNVSYLLATGAEVSGLRARTRVAGRRRGRRTTPATGPGQRVSEPGGPRPTGPPILSAWSGLNGSDSAIFLISAAGQTVHTPSCR